MAKRIITQITDDLDGSKDAQTYSFAWQGNEYTIDLSKKNAKAFEKMLQPYIAAASKVTGRARSTAPKSSKASRRDLAEVRAWAKENGFQVSERGRISAAVLTAYDAR
ncbi:MAG: Lsr2 family protein [Marmoricola sp.]